jgi:hypothetical protein
MLAAAHLPFRDHLGGNIGKVVVPVGKVVVHNHVKPSRIVGNRGFRAWLSAPKNREITVCDCAWAPELGQHFQMKRVARERARLIKLGQLKG